MDPWISLGWSKVTKSRTEWSGKKSSRCSVLEVCIIREFPWVPCVQWESPGNGNRWASFTGMGMGMGTA